MQGAGDGLDMAFMDHSLDAAASSTFSFLPYFPSFLPSFITQTHKMPINKIKVKKKKNSTNPETNAVSIHLPPIPPSAAHAQAAAAAGAAIK